MMHTTPTINPCTRSWWANPTRLNLSIFIICIKWMFLIVHLMSGAHCTLQYSVYPLQTSETHDQYLFAFVYHHRDGVWLQVSFIWLNRPFSQSDFWWWWLVFTVPLRDLISVIFTSLYRVFPGFQRSCKCIQHPSEWSGYSIPTSVDNCWWGGKRRRRNTLLTGNICHQCYPCLLISFVAAVLVVFTILNETWDGCTKKTYVFSCYLWMGWKSSY